MTFDLWTLGFQAVNVLVLIWLLQRFFWKPVAAMIAERQDKAATVLAEADAQRRQAKVALTEIETTRTGLVSERDAMIAAARKDADAARDAVMKTAREEADALHDTAKEARVRAAATLKINAIEEAQGLALTIAGQLLARLDGPATQSAFLGWLSDGLSALSDADRAALLDAKLEVVSAAEAGKDAQDRITSAVAKALGAPATLTFRTDPALIAGLELHSPHFSLRNSWRADLARIAAALEEKGDLSDAA